jgi:hypothetical protein
MIESRRERNMCNNNKAFDGIDCCVDCHEELAIMERNRSKCWNCLDKISETYADDHIDVEDGIN